MFRTEFPNAPTKLSNLCADMIANSSSFSNALKLFLMLIGLLLLCTLTNGNIHTAEATMILSEREQTPIPLDWIRHYDTSLVERTVLVNRDSFQSNELVIVAQKSQENAYVAMKTDRGLGTVWSRDLPLNFVPLSLAVSSALVLVSGYYNTTGGSYHNEIPGLISIGSTTGIQAWAYDHVNNLPALPNGRISSVTIDQTSGNIYATGSIGLVDTLTGNYTSSIWILQVSNAMGTMIANVTSSIGEGFNVGTTIESTNGTIVIASRVSVSVDACSNSYTTGGLLSILESSGTSIDWSLCRHFPNSYEVNVTAGPFARVKGSQIVFVEPTFDVSCHIIGSSSLADIVPPYQIVASRTAGSQMIVNAVSWYSSQELVITGSISGSVTLMTSQLLSSVDQRDGFVLAWDTSNYASSGKITTFGRVGDDFGTDLVVDGQGNILVTGYVATSGVSWGHTDLLLENQSAFVAQLRSGATTPNIILAQNVTNDLNLTTSSYSYSFSGEIFVVDSEIICLSNTVIFLYRASLKLINSTVSLIGTSSQGITLNQISVSGSQLSTLIDCDQQSLVQLYRVSMQSLTQYIDALVKVDGGSIDLSSVTMGATSTNYVLLTDSISAQIVGSSFLNGPVTSIAVTFTEMAPTSSIHIRDNTFSSMTSLTVTCVTDNLDNLPRKIEVLGNTMLSSHVYLTITTSTDILISDNDFQMGGRVWSSVKISASNYFVIRSNKFAGGSEPIYVLSLFKGSYLITNNSITTGGSTTEQGAFNFISSTYCNQRIEISRNVFTFGLATFYPNLVQLNFDISCRKAEFTNNSIGGASTIKLKGGLHFSRNMLANSVDFHYNNTNSKVLTAQFNYWGEESYSLVKAKVNPLNSISVFFTPFLNSTGGVVYDNPQFSSSTASDCHTIKALYSSAPTGVYTIYPACIPTSVRCNMDEGTGSIVLQRRITGEQNFDMNWNDYRDGFGDLDEEFVTGLSLMNFLTFRNASVTIRLENYNQEISTLFNGSMSVGSSEDGYPLTLNIEGNNLIEGLPFQATGKPNGTLSCVNSKSGWWFSSDCNVMNLNGNYSSGILFPNFNYPITSTEIMIKLNPKQQIALQCPQALCGGISSSDPTVCSGHGDCVAFNLCSCNDGYRGGNCATKIWSCYGIDRQDITVCSGHGLCESQDVCNCSRNYQGETCNSTIRDPVGVKFDTYLQSVAYCENPRVIARISGENNRTNLTYKWFADALNPTPASAILLQNLNDELSGMNNYTITIDESLLFGSVILHLEVYEDGLFFIGEGSLVLSKGSVPNFSSSIIVEIDSPWIVPADEPLTVYAYLSSNASCVLNNKLKDWTVNGFNQPSTTTLNNYWSFVIIPSHSQTSQTFNLRVGINGAPSYSSKKLTLQTYITKPTAIISGGSRVMFQGDSNFLDASGSSDEKQRGNRSDTLFVWTCEGCKNTYPGNTSIIIIREDVGSYKFKLAYWPNILFPNRTAVDEVNIDIVESSTFSPTLKFKSILADYTDPHKKLRLEGVFEHRLDRYTVENEWIMEDLHEGSTQSFGITSTLVPLVLEEGFLSMNHTYKFTLRSRYVKAPKDVYGTVYSVTTVVSSPEIRSYSFYPSTGLALSTEFSFSISAIDIIESYPLRYTLAYLHPMEKRYIVLRALASSGSILSPLPGFNGSESISMRYTVTNVYGSSSSIEFQVPLNSDMDELTLSSRLQDIIGVITSPSRSRNPEPYMSVAVSAIDSLATINVSVTTMMDEVLDFIIAQSDDEIASSQTVSLGSTLARLEFIHILSRPFNQFSEHTTNSSLLAFDRVLDSCVSSKSDILSAAEIQISSTISNLFIATRDINSTFTLSKFIPRLVEVISSQMLVAENQSLLTTESYDLAIRVDDQQSMLNSLIRTGHARIIMPTSMNPLGDGTFIVQALSIDSYDSKPTNYTNDNGTDVYSSPIVEFKVMQNGEKIKLQNLKKPIEIVLRRDLPLDYNLTDHRIHCFYKDEMNEENWRRDGCKLFRYNSTDIVCRCTHTTSFSSLVIYDPKQPNKASTGLYATWIAVHSIFAVCCLVLLVASFVWYDKQPIRSRFLTPFIGLSAILAESVLNGIIRNSLLIAANDAKDFRGVNSIAYVIMSIVNPLVLLSLFIYLWQMLRYFFLKNLYAIMDFSDPNQTKMRILRVLSSKIVYVVLGLVIWTSSTMYFVIVSILESTNVIKANPASAFNALSYSLMSLTLGVLIIATFIWDLTIILSRKFYKRQIKERNEEHDDVAEIHVVKRAIGTVVNHFTHDDPLLFRIESIFMVSAMFLMIISYIIGISDRYDKQARPNSPAKVFEFLFDLAYIICRIIAFGGFSVVVRVIHRFKFHNNYEEYTALKSSISNLKTGTSVVEARLQNMLRDALGYEAFSTYCKKEFALENLLLWKRLETLRSDNMVFSDDKRRAAMKTLDEDFIARGSHYECNIPSKVRKQFYQTLKSGVFSAAEVEETLLALSNEVMINICDTFTRFSVSTEYAQYMKMSQMVTQMKHIGKLEQKIE